MILADLTRPPLNHLIDRELLSLWFRVGTALGQVKMNIQQIPVRHGTGFPYGSIALVNKKKNPFNDLCICSTTRASILMSTDYVCYAKLAT